MITGEALNLTRKLVRIESTNPGVGEKNVEEFIKEYLSVPGIRITENEVFDGRRNLIAEITSYQFDKEAPALVLICHMDTVVVGKDWTRDPFGADTERERIYGRGSCDMKSGLACALSVFKETARRCESGECRLKRPLRLICTVDEEGDMNGVECVVRWNQVRKEDWVMDLEPTDGQIQMSHKGRFWLELSSHGITAHASKPEQGADAIAAMAECISDMRNSFAQFPVHEELGRTTVTFGQIQGGYQPYVVPDECKLWVDCRLTPPTTDTKVLEITDRAIAYAQNAVPGVKFEYRITGNRPYIEKNDESGFLKELKKAVQEVTGEKPSVRPFPGYTDTAVIAGKLGNRNCLSYGPGNLKYAHKPDEFVEIADIERCEQVLRQLIVQLKEET